MKKVIVNLDEATSMLYTTSGIYLCAINADDASKLPQAEQGSNLKELIAAGMTADDLIKLKHGGVL